MSSAETLPNRPKKNRRILMALVVIVVAGLILAAAVTYEGPEMAAGPAPIHVTGSITGAIEYYTQAPFVVPGAGQSINTHSDFFVYTGGMSGNSTILLQPEVSTADIIHASFIGPFAGTVGNSAPGSFTMIGTFHVDASGPIWKIHNTFSVSDGLDGLAGICGGGTVTGVSVGPIPPNGLVSFSLTYEATFRFGAHCHSR